jgi:DHA2 family multidrug resistance protein-like MFS transporter
MSTAQSSAKTETQWKPNDAWLIGIVLAVINFWLFAQTLLNVIPGIQGSLGIERTVGNLAVSITSLFSGIFIVVAGGLADRLGRVKIMNIGIYLSILGSLLIALTPENAGGLTAVALLGGRVVQGLSAACIMPSTMALVKNYYEGKERQRALSFWSIGSWGGSGFCALFGGLMATSALGWRSIFWISIVLSVVGPVPAARHPGVQVGREGRRHVRLGRHGEPDRGAGGAERVHLAGPADRLAELGRHRANRRCRDCHPCVLRHRDQPA